MKARKILTLAGGLLVIVILIYSFYPGDPVPYEDMILENREAIDQFMRLDDESPLPDSVKQNFAGLRYFAPDPAFRIEAHLDRIPQPETLTVATSDGLERVYLKYAYANFTLSGRSHRLMLLKPTDEQEEYLFLPFGDATNGEETYGGGRYLDLKVPSQDKMVIDFNDAYNPYCVYNVQYSCPLPPSENILAVAVRAGQLNYP